MYIALVSRNILRIRTSANNLDKKFLLRTHFGFSLARNWFNDWVGEWTKTTISFLWWLEMVLNSKILFLKQKTLYPFPINERRRKCAEKDFTFFKYWFLFPYIIIHFQTANTLSSSTSKWSWAQVHSQKVVITRKQTSMEMVDFISIRRTYQLFWTDYHSDLESKLSNQIYFDMDVYLFLLLLLQ